MCDVAVYVLSKFPWPKTRIQVIFLFPQCDTGMLLHISYVLVLGLYRSGLPFCLAMFRIVKLMQKVYRASF